MFSIGFSEILIILVVMIVFIKPEELPEFFRKIGRLFGELNRMKNELKKLAETKSEEDKKNDSK